MFCLIVDKQRIREKSSKHPQDKYFPYQQATLTLLENLCKRARDLQLQACNLIEETDQVKWSETD